MLDSSHELRAYAAARLGNKTDADPVASSSETLWVEMICSARDSVRRCWSFSLATCGTNRRYSTVLPANGQNPSGRSWESHRFTRLLQRSAQQTDKSRAADYADRAIENLEKSIKYGETRSIWWFLTDPFFQYIVDNPGMIRIQFEAELDNVSGTLAARKGDAAAYLVRGAGVPAEKMTTRAVI